MEKGLRNFAIKVSREDGAEDLTINGITDIV